MRYYVFCVSKSASGENRETFGYDSLDMAEAKFHAVLSSAQGGNIINYVLIKVMDSEGIIKFNRVWNREITE